VNFDMTWTDEVNISKISRVWNEREIDLCFDSLVQGVPKLAKSIL